MAAWAAGLLQGVSEGISEAHDKRAERVREQMKEAKNLAKAMNERRAAATEVAQKIKNANARFGVSEKRLYSAWKAGQLDNLLSLYENPNLSPEMRENLWKVPNETMVDPNGVESIYEQINKAMGVIKQGVNNLPEVDDYSVGNLLYDIIGGNGVDAVNRSLTGRTVEGYHVPELLDMPSPEGVQPDEGANYDYDALRKLEEMDALRKAQLNRIGRPAGGSKKKAPFIFDVPEPVIKAAAENMTTQVIQRLGVPIGDVQREEIYQAIYIDMYSEISRRRNAAANNEEQFLPAFEDFTPERYLPFITETVNEAGRGTGVAIDSPGMLRQGRATINPPGEVIQVPGVGRVEIVEDNRNDPQDPHVIARNPARAPSDPDYLIRLVPDE